MSYPDPCPYNTAVCPSKGHHCGSGGSGQMLPWGWSPHPVSGIVAQPRPTLCDPVDYSPPRSSVHGIPRARILEWVARPFSRKSAQPRDQTCVSCIAGRFFTTSAWETLCDFGGTHPSTHPISQLLLSVHPGLLRGVAG